MNLSKSKYVIQRLDDEGNAEHSFVAPLQAPTKELEWRSTDDLDEADGFSSKLSAEHWIENHADQLDAARWHIVKRDQIVVKPKKFEPPFDLNINDPLEAVTKTHELHFKYCSTVESWLSHAGIKGSFHQPAVCCTITSPTWAGLYSSETHTCHYPVVYAMIAKDWQIICAHEVVHAYQRLFTGHSPGHGPDFYAMMKHAAKEPVTSHHHSYNIAEAKRLSTKLLPWWELTRQQGLLASLPCEVLTTKTKRKGLK